MNLKSLRKLIKEEVEAALDEAPKTRGKAPPPPKEFGEFRQLFAAALAAAGASPNIVSDAEDSGYEGGAVFGEIWQAWTEVEQHLRGNRELDQDDWFDIVEFSVHDAAVNIAADLMSGRVDVKQFATAVVEFFETGVVKKRPEVISFDRASITEKVKMLLKKAGLKTRKPKKHMAGSDRYVYVTGSSMEAVSAAIDPYFINLGFEKTKYGGLEKHIGYTGEISITLEPEEGTGDIEVWVDVLKRGGY